MKTANRNPKHVSQALVQLMKSGIRAERIACELDVAFGTVKSWVTGQRRPKRATIQQIEHIFGVKIL